MASDLSWEEIHKLVTYLKERSHEWTFARLFVLVSIVMVARLKPRSEAGVLRWSDISPDSPKNGVRRGHLLEILDRWSRWAGSEYVIPNQTKSGPWGISSSRAVSVTPNARIAKICNELHINEVTLADLKSLSDNFTARIWKGDDSPFALLPGDGVLLPRRESIESARDAVINHYLPSQKSCRRSMAKAFRIIETMHGVSTTSDLESPDFVDRFSEIAGVASPYARPVSPIIGTLRTAMNILIGKGMMTSSPFSGKPGFKEIIKEPWRPNALPRGKKTKRHDPDRKAPIVIPGPGAFPLAGGEPVQVDLTPGERSILTVLEDGWKESERFTYNQLNKRCGIESSRKMIYRMSGKPGYEAIVARIDKSDGRPTTVSLNHPRHVDS